MKVIYIVAALLPLENFTNSLVLGYIPVLAV